MNVPMLDLKAQYEPIMAETLKAVTDVIDSRYFCNGPAVAELEKLLADYHHCAAAVGVSSGTDALLVSLMALDIGPGDEVITTPFTFFGTSGVIRRVGAKPVYVDIEPDTFNIDATKIAAAVTERTKAILPVHLYGQMADMDEIMAVASAHGLHVIEDAAQSVGATYKERKACSIGTMGCLSFYPTKNLGAMGDAGMVLTNNTDLADKLRALRNHGQGSTYIHKWVGGNFRMDTIEAAGLIVKMQCLDGWTAILNEHGKLYNELLAGCDTVTAPTIRPYNRSVYHQYVIRTPRRDELRAHLGDKGVATGVYYPLSLHLQECFANLGYGEGDFPESERASREVLALPIYPEMRVEQVRYVAEQIVRFFD